jgi:hypothetical protein
METILQNILGTIVTATSVPAGHTIFWIGCGFAMTVLAFVCGIQAMVLYEAYDRKHYHDARPVYHGKRFRA